MSVSSSQSSSPFKINQCDSSARAKVNLNPTTSLEWENLVQRRIVNHASPLEPELRKGLNHIRLCGLRRWESGKEKVKGSALHIEHFLHFRALVQQHGADDFPLRELVKSKYAEAAESFLSTWQDFDNYIMQVPSNDPAIDVDSLGLFAGAKLVQNQVLLDAYLGTSEDSVDSFQDSILETPLKKTKQGIDFNNRPPDHDAADEQIVNEALISFASALTRRWMIEQTPAAIYAAEQTPTKGGSAAPTHDWKTVGDWTMVRDRFHIRERVDKDDLVQRSHMLGLRASSRGDNFETLGDNHEYGRVLTCETDGSLYRIGASTTEVLAIVEAKKRLRKKNRLKIEWQEAAEILAWLNVRLRTESEDNYRGKDNTERRGVLEPKPAEGNAGEKSRCLLVAQDREEIYLVVGEWDALYEEYALQGKFSASSRKSLEDLRATADAAYADTGFLTLHVYGPFGGHSGVLSSPGGSMRKLSANLLALSLHLSEASCSPSSRRISPAGSIQLPTPRGPGKPCCAGCTCNCRCKKTTTGSRDPSKSGSDTSDGQRGRREGSRGGSRPRDPSTKRTPSRPSHDSGERDSTPTRDPRAGVKRPGEGRAASARDQSVPRPSHGQAHDDLPLRGRPTATDQQAGSSDVPARTGRSKSRGRDAAAAGHHGQVPAPAGSLPRPPPLPETSGAPGQAPRQREQQQTQQPPHAQEGQGAQQHRDPRRVPTIPGPQQPQNDPFGGAGPSRQPQTGQSSVSAPPGAAVPPGRRDSSRPQRDPGETPGKRKKIKNVLGFRKKKDEDDKR